MVFTTKAGKRILNAIFFMIFSFMSVISYAQDAPVSQPETPESISHAKEPLKLEKASVEKAPSDEFCVAETFNGLMNWFAEQFEFIEEKYLNHSNTEVASETMQDYDLVEDEPITAPTKPLDLSIPDVAHDEEMEMKSGTKAMLPNLFVEQEKPYVKEKPSASFGGRILMDDAELEDMQEYRLKDVSGAVRGAEVSLEFKTN